MPAGLLQIATNGASDVYLMGVPEMTFFKTVYHRYVNFSIETKELYFDDTPDFGNTVSCTLSSLIGDLVYRILLVIDLPEVILLRSTNETLINNALAELNTAKDDYNNFNTYANYVYDAYNIIQTGLAPDNSDPNDIYTQVNYYFNATIDVDQYNAIVATLPSQITTNSDILTIISNINSNTSLTSDQKLIEMSDKTDSVSVYLTSINRYYFDTYIEKLNIYNDLTNQRYNFAWIERLGHYIFDYIDLEIGGIKYL